MSAEVAVPPGNVELLRGTYWRINLNESFGMPGYLFLQCLRDVRSFQELSDGEAAEMGLLLKHACAAAEDVLQPKLVVTGRFGLVPGHAIHFHIVPVFETLLERYAADHQDNNPDGYPAVPDGAELLAYAWRDACGAACGPKGRKADTPPLPS